MRTAGFFWLAIIDGLAAVYILPTVIGIARQVDGLGLVICLNVFPDARVACAYSAGRQWLREQIRQRSCALRQDISPAVCCWPGISAYSRGGSCRTGSAGAGRGRSHCITMVVP